MFYEVRRIENPDARMEEIAPVIRLAFSDVATEFGLTPSNCANHPSFLSDAAMLEHLQRPGVISFGAFANDSNDALVGFVAIWPKGHGVYELTRLCVLPEHRHFGLGKQLAKAAFQSAKEHGACRLVIGIIDANERLKRWYGELGFREERKREYSHLPFAVCEMERCL